MGKVKKKVAISKKEEEQAQKVVKIVFVSLIILALIMLIAFSFFRLISSPQIIRLTQIVWLLIRINIKSDLC